MEQTANITAVRVDAKSREKSGLAKLLLSMAKIGVIGFGGGSALIPVIEDEVVDEQKLISKKDYDEEVVSACVTPGALPVEIAAGVGRKTFGLKGMILAALLMALPGAFLTVLLLSVLSGRTDSSLDVIRYISIGLGGFISSLLANYAYKTTKTASREGRKTLIASVIIMITVFALTGLKSLFSLLGLEKIADSLIKLSTFQVLMLSFAILIAVYAVQTFLKNKKQKSVKTDSKSKRVSYSSIIIETAAWLGFAVILTVPAILVLGDGISYILKGFASSFMSFGGGDAYLSVADGLFVNTGMVKENDFYGILVPIANVLPGSILSKILTGVGYLIGAEQSGVQAGIAGALAGFAISVAASGMVFGAVYWIFRTFENVSFFQLVSKWIRPIISGLLLGVMVTMFKTNVQTAGALGYRKAGVLVITAVITVADLYFLNRKKTGNLIPMAASAAAGALALLAI